MSDTGYGIRSTEYGIMQPSTQVGFVGYGAYVPRHRLPATEVARVWRGGEGGLPVTEKAVPGPDEDTLTIALEAARNALARAGIESTLPTSKTTACSTSSIRRPSRPPPSAA